MNISIGCNIQSGPFGGGNQLNRALADHFIQLGHKVEFDLKSKDLDLIILVDPRTTLRSISFGDKEILKYLLFSNSKTLVLQVIHECDERKGTSGLNERLWWANNIADHSVFISDWQHKLFLEKKLVFNNDLVIRNGSDEKIFLWDGKPKWNGSSPLKLVTHHWSNNWMKGFDIYEKLDHMVKTEKWKNKIEFTYIGNVPNDFNFHNSKLVEPLSGLDLAKELSNHHIYVTGSINEPAGLHHIEGALSGLPILYRESGALPEYCNGFGESFTGVDDFTSALEKVINNYNFLNEKLKKYPYSFKKMCCEYEDLINNMIKNRDELIKKRESRSSWLWKVKTLLGITPRFNA